MRFVHEGRLAGRNEEIAANRSHWAAGAKVKKDTEDALRYSILVAVRDGSLLPTRKPVEVYIEWHEAPRRRDVDNIQSSTKYVLDALVRSGIIQNDNQTWVKQVWQKVVQDVKDFVVVELSEVGYTIKENNNGC